MGNVAIYSEITDKMMRNASLGLFRIIRSNMRSALERKLVLEGVESFSPEQWSHEYHATRLPDCIVPGSHWKWVVSRIV